MKRLLLSPLLALAILMGSCFGVASSPLPAAVSGRSAMSSGSYEPEMAAPIGQLWYVYSYGWMYVYMWNGFQWILLTFYPWP